MEIGITVNVYMRAFAFDGRCLISPINWCSHQWHALKHP